MALDTTALSTLALELIERIADAYDELDNPEVGAVALIVEVNGEVPGDPEGRSATWIDYRCNEPRRWVQVGLFQAAERAALNDGGG